MLEILCTGIVKFLLHTTLMTTILVVAEDVVVAEDSVVVEDLVVAEDSVALDALDALDAAVVAVVVVVAVAEDLAVVLDSAWTEYALFNSYFLIETLLKEKRFYMNFIVETLFFKYDKPLFFFPFDIRKNSIHKIVMTEVIMLIQEQ